MRQQQDMGDISVQFLFSSLQRCLQKERQLPFLGIDQFFFYEGKESFGDQVAVHAGKVNNGADIVLAVYAGEDLFFFLVRSEVALPFRIKRVSRVILSLMIESSSRIRSPSMRRCWVSSEKGSSLSCGTPCTANS